MKNFAEEETQSAHRDDQGTDGQFLEPHKCPSRFLISSSENLSANGVELG